MVVVPEILATRETSNGCPSYTNPESLGTPTNTPTGYVVVDKGKRGDGNPGLTPAEDGASSGVADDPLTICV